MKSPFALSAIACLATAAFLSDASASPAADMFALTYLGPKIETFDPAVAKGGVVGTETFNELPVSEYGNGAAFATAFGTGGVISGSYAGAFGISPANLYGGVGGTGRYIVTFDHGGGYTIGFAHSAAIPGVNFFAMDLEALDAGNLLGFYRAGQLVYSYAPADLIADLGSCGGSNPYCGNPTTGADGGEQFAFVNFFDTSGYFDQITFHEDPSVGGGYESANHTIGYVTPAAIVNSIPEPAMATMLACMAIGLLVVNRHRVRPHQEPNLIGISTTRSVPLSPEPIA